MEMMKAELIRHVADETNTPYARVQKVVDALCEAIIRETAAGSTVRIPPLGTFRKTAKAARTMKNPLTGKEMDVAAHGAVRFGPSTMFKTAVR